MPELSSRPSAAQILHDARWMAGLTQAEVAQRAGMTRQTVSMYEAGQRQPSVRTLERILAGCGMRLRMSVVPVPGLEDHSTRQLLRLDRERRVDPPVLNALAALAAVTADAGSMLVTGKVAARLHGAALRVREIDILVGADLPLDEVVAWLASAGARDPYSDAPDDLAVAEWGRYDDRRFEVGEVDVVVRRVPYFESRLGRSSVWTFSAPDLGLADEYTIRLDGPDECVEAWHPRDRDRLAVQRAIRLAATPDEPEADDPLLDGSGSFPVLSDDPWRMWD